MSDVLDAKDPEAVVQEWLGADRMLGAKIIEAVLSDQRIYLMERKRYAQTHGGTAQTDDGLRQYGHPRREP